MRSCMLERLLEIIECKKDCSRRILMEIGEKRNENFVIILKLKENFTN